jgi:putative N6-adenine-specific DNA methylase
MMQKIDWSKYVANNGTIWLDSTVSSPQFTNSQYISQLGKDAIVDQFREKTGERPSVEKVDSDLRINIYIGKLGHTTISLDSSGDSLHRRGYRRSTGLAPLNEVTAAGLLLLADYTGDRPFVDPMCGSGTIVCEAAMIAANRAPGLNRKFGFENWPDFNMEILKTVRADAKAAERIPAHPILGSDIDHRSTSTTEDALRFLELEQYVKVNKADFKELEPLAPLPDHEPGAILVTNPPYELRLKTGDIDGFYKEIGDTFKQKYTGYAAWIFSANRDALKRVGLRTSRKVILMNGPLEARSQRYDMYKASRKNKE